MPVAEVFAPMTGDEHEGPRSPVRADGGTQRIVDRHADGRLLLPRELHEKRVDDRVPRHLDGLGGNTLPQQCRSSGPRRREMKGHDRRSQTSVYLFGEWSPDVPGSQSRLDVPDRDASIEAREGGDQSGRGVALHQGHVRLACLEPPIDSLHQTGGEPRERLACLHRGKVDVHGEPELFRYLLEHLAVLPGGDDTASQEIAAL